MEQHASTAFSAEIAERVSAPHDALRRSILYATPLVAFAGIAVAFAWGLTGNPQEIPSALNEKLLPSFSLLPAERRELGLSSVDLKGEVSPVHASASWCVACRPEHSLFMELAARKVVPITGLNHKDTP